MCYVKWLLQKVEQSPENILKTSVWAAYLSLESLGSMQQNNQAWRHAWWACASVSVGDGAVDFWTPKVPP